MAENYTLRVKIGNAEFDADGPESTVKEAYRLFLDTIKATGTATAPKDKIFRDPDPVDQGLFDRAFKLDEKREVVSLKFQPTTEGDQQKADAAILLIYGFQQLLNLENVRITKLNEGIRQTGLTQKRMDGFIGVHKRLYLKSGQRAGSRYALTNAGEEWAAKTLSDVFGKG